MTKKLSYILKLKLKITALMFSLECSISCNIKYNLYLKRFQLITVLNHKP